MIILIIMIQNIYIEDEYTLYVIANNEMMQVTVKMNAYSSHINDLQR